ncbi:hypothetical protein CVT24_008020 [Panaeolus cyanescens]|uniref:P-loop containing nucleoside triphosphate hydrolase protein n=1 Tax=Panaeolus cyanescens TaxID=181874 RepID=A0A409YQY0_9AGAR|nr:hypothetical protein CVT24_008020 [Panaeolus cyanescens]
MTATFAYATILALSSFIFPSNRFFSTTCNVILLLSAFTTYAYRDIWPLATYTLPQLDASEGEILWFKLALLLFTAVIIPLFIPRRYIPVDPKDPMEVPNPEQTCSIFALAVHSYIDPVIFQGARVSHLPPEDLPPLSDTDWSKNLKQRGFPHLDPFLGGKKQHLFFGILKVYKKEFILNALNIVGQSFCSFASPIGINRILSYMESGGQGATMRPWFWILWIVLGPVFRTTLFQWYIFISTRTLARTEVLLTQLVFEHSLRIRLKSETPPQEASVNDNASTVVGTPDSASIAESSDQSSKKQATDSSDAASTASGPGPSSASSRTVVGQGQQKKDVQASPPTPVPDLKKRDSGNLIGKINNLVTTDVNNIVEGRDFFSIRSFTNVFLYILFVPNTGVETDARVQDVTEAMNVLRMIKLFGWENRVADRIQEKRNEELKYFRRLRILEAFNGIINSVIPTLTMVATYATYTLIMKEELNASKIFSSISVFSLLRLQLNRISYQTTTLVQAKVSLDRMDDFLHKTELLDSYKEEENTTDNTGSFHAIPSHMEGVVGFQNATFSWSDTPSDESMTPRSRAFQLKIKGEMFFKPNCINMIIGPTGSGKTSLLMALLGEMHFIHDMPDSSFNLPREGGVAYAAQESWVQNETIRENILFGSPFDEERYKKVINQCALERDLDLFDAGDQTEVGEKGLTLSGGQKARITLARAIYSSANILLLDDILAALDVHTSIWIVDKCLKGDLVQGRTVIFVTHNVALVGPIAKYVVALGQDGNIKYNGTDILAAVPNLAQTTKELEEELQTVEATTDSLPQLKSATQSNGKLMVAEEIAKGHVTWKSFRLYLSAIGGEYPAIFFTVWIGGFILSDWLNTFQTWFLGYWGSQYETHHKSEVPVQFYLSIFSLILTISMTVYSSTFLFFVSGVLRASRKLNAMLVTSVLTSTFRWLDLTPTGRIIARCTQDIRAIDGPLANSFAAVVDISTSMITRLLVVVVFTPVFLVPAISVVAAGAYLGNLYLKSQLSVKREMSNARSPLLSHFSAAITGIVSVRAYNAQTQFKSESLKRVDRYLRISRVSYNLNRWIGIRADYLAALFSAALATYLVYFCSVGAANTGFTLNMAVDLCSSMLWGVRLFNELEVQANSLERVQDYLKIEHEPPSTPSGKPPAAWPRSGDLLVENLTARYSENGPPVLRNISFHIKSGQRIGIVGRTGSGKSSLTLAILRCILTEGTIYYDGIPTKSINLDALRSNITIIPQTPELLSGTLRRNLDPFEQYDDATLNDALRAAGLFSLQDDLGEGRLTLDSTIASGGSNLSVGQRQIIALARAMVRGSKLLILDEATSAIDYKTDSVIQDTLRNQMDSDVTIITVAHRLQTIMDADSIMVLDNGSIVEFDSPKTLLGKEGGMLKSLVDNSKDRDMLYSMTQG